MGAVDGRRGQAMKFLQDVPTSPKKNLPGSLQHLPRAVAAIRWLGLGLTGSASIGHACRDKLITQSGHIDFFPVESKCDFVIVTVPLFGRENIGMCFNRFIYLLVLELRLERDFD